MPVIFSFIKMTKKQCVRWLIYSAEDIELAFSDVESQVFQKNAGFNIFP